MKKWQRPGFISIISLLLIILMIPTLIVVPFIDSGDKERAPEQMAKDKNGKLIELPADLSPFDINVLRTATDEVETVPLEDYVARVVASEMPADFEMEALKAQALAARTYIVKHYTSGEKVSGKADVTDTVQHQVYKNTQELRNLWKEDFEEKMTKINSAVKNTAGEILTYKNQPIFAAFFSTSNGFTENSEDYWPNPIPYLKSVESPWDENSPKFLDQKVISVQDAEAKLGVDFPQNINNTKITLTDSKRVNNITVGGETLSGREVREKLELRSTDFTIDKKDGHLIFTTRGYGHGVGMSQYGANGMAKQGKDYKDIVKHYYKGTEITELEQLNSLASAMETKK
ncbi:stage II sporulation protein D [Thalassobacillus pellis]|uniref:stage II sporulation protein D n=1 Tax=Thalassobacillus pellis TaxID=748008 RepID=UPI001961D5EF|nr:stage II sporulation protein D [Thalassobacillus pellis]MBM7551743.1 stage II sporulation protein D [Thalassobacillus pellis]